MEPETTEVIVLSPDELEALRQFGKDHGVRVEVQPSRGFEPVSTVVALVVGGTAAVGTVLHLVDRSKGGQMVDLRPGAERVVFRTPDVVYGLVVCVAVDGEVTVEVKEPRGLFGSVAEMLAAIVSDMGGKPVDEVAGQVRELVGNDARVSVSHQRVT